MRDVDDMVGVPRQGISVGEKAGADPRLLRSVRGCAGLTQAQLAERWGRSQSAVARVENSPLASATLRTIVSYVVAVGGSCRLTVDIGGCHFELDTCDLLVHRRRNSVGRRRKGRDGR